MMIDEVHGGMGRTGKWFAHQWRASCLTSCRWPKAWAWHCQWVVVAGPRAANVLQPGNHGTTFGGNPLAMRAGIETIRHHARRGPVENAAPRGCLT